MNFRFCVAGSPDYLETNGKPQCIEDLAKHNCIVYSMNRPGQGAEWTFGNGNDKQNRKIRVYGNWSSNNCYTLIAAARKNLGLTCLPDFLMAADIASGQLVPVLSDVSLSSSIWAVYHSKKHVPAKVSKFIKYLHDEFNNNPPWHDEQIAKQDFLSSYGS